MGKTRKTPSIVTFKADPSLLEALQGIENRSEFIRAALLSALDNICPLCKGRGLLTPNQKEHWASLAADHSLEECDDCHEFYLVCRRPSGRRAERGRRQRRGRRRTGSPAARNS
jgi:hypothetical protein